MLKLAWILFLLTLLGSPNWIIFNAAREEFQGNFAEQSEFHSGHWQSFQFFKGMLFFAVYLGSLLDGQFINSVPVGCLPSCTSLSIVRCQNTCHARDPHQSETLSRLDQQVCSLIEFASCWFALIFRHITSFKGLHNSFEKEFFDMSRGAFLKYYFQVCRCCFWINESCNSYS
jgi:hypothetical protein